MDMEGEAFYYTEWWKKTVVYILERLWDAGCSTGILSYYLIFSNEQVQRCQSPFSNEICTRAFSSVTLTLEQQDAVQLQTVILFAATELLVSQSFPGCSTSCPSIKQPFTMSDKPSGCTYVHAWVREFSFTKTFYLQRFCNPVTSVSKCYDFASSRGSKAFNTKSEITLRGHFDGGTWLTFFSSQKNQRIKWGVMLVISSLS